MSAGVTKSLKSLAITDKQNAVITQSTATETDQQYLARRLTEVTKKNPIDLLKIVTLTAQSFRERKEPESEMPPVEKVSGQLTGIEFDPSRFDIVNTGFLIYKTYTILSQVANKTFNYDALTGKELIQIESDIRMLLDITRHHTTKLTDKGKIVQQHAERFLANIHKACAQVMADMADTRAHAEGFLANIREVCGQTAGEPTTRTTGEPTTRTTGEKTEDQPGN